MVRSTVLSKVPLLSPFLPPILSPFLPPNHPLQWFLDFSGLWDQAHLLAGNSFWLQGPDVCLFIYPAPRAWVYLMLKNLPFSLIVLKAQPGLCKVHNLAFPMVK